MLVLRFNLLSPSRWQNCCCYVFQQQTISVVISPGHMLVFSMQCSDKRSSSFVVWNTEMLVLWLHCLLQQSVQVHLHKHSECLIDMRILAGCCVCVYHGWHLLFPSCCLIFSILPALTVFPLHVPNSLSCVYLPCQSYRRSLSCSYKSCNIYIRLPLAVSVVYSRSQSQTPQTKRKDAMNLEYGISAFLILHLFHRYE